MQVRYDGGLNQSEAVDIRQEVVLEVESRDCIDELDINVYGKRKMQDNVCVHVCTCMCLHL